MTRTGSETTASGWNNYTISVSEGMILRIKSYQQNTAPLFIVKANDTIINSYPIETAIGAMLEKVYIVPANATSVVVNENTNQVTAKIVEWNGYKYNSEIPGDVEGLKWFSDNLSIERYTRGYNGENLKTGATKTTGKFMRRNNASSDASGWNYYTVNVSPGWTVRIKSYQSSHAMLAIVCASDDSVISAYPAETASGAVMEIVIQIPEGASYIVVNENESQYTAEIERVYGVKYFETGDQSAPITFVKSGHNIQIRTPFEKTEKFMAINCTDNGSQNGGFNFSDYILLDTLPVDPSQIATGTRYKQAGDDICPIHYNGSYRGANHGKSPTFKITATGHGKTEADIGSVWKGANNKQYVIYRIDSENEFSVIGNLDGSRYDVVIATPTTPLSHVSGATHTDSVSFSTATSIQMLPTFKNYHLTFTDENGKQITGNGAYSAYNYFQVDEYYELFDVVDLVTKLIANVGSNTNASYYDVGIESDLIIQNSYKVFANGSIVVACNAIPMKSGVYVEYFGGVQSIKIGDDIYAPFTTLDSIQTQGSSSIELTPSAWRDPDFPAYKMYQFSGNNGFAVGYCIDYGQGIPATRKTKVAEGSGAGFWYGSSHKMYPHFYEYVLTNAPDLYGNALSFYAFRAPVQKSNNMTVIWYEIGDAVYVEIETFAQTSAIVDLPAKCAGRKIGIVKKTDSISIPVDIASAEGFALFATGAGSATIKLQRT